MCECSECIFAPGFHSLNLCFVCYIYCNVCDSLMLHIYKSLSPSVLAQDTDKHVVNNNQKRKKPSGVSRSNLIVLVMFVSGMEVLCFSSRPRTELFYYGVDHLLNNFGDRLSSFQVPWLGQEGRRPLHLLLNRRLGYLFKNSTQPYIKMTLKMTTIKK